LTKPIVLSMRKTDDAPPYEGGAQVTLDPAYEFSLLCAMLDECLESGQRCVIRTATGDFVLLDPELVQSATLRQQL
jgi:hypothetical protein